MITATIHPTAGGFVEFIDIWGRPKPANGIEWSAKSWNPTIGCSLVSDGCKNCYAMTMASRIANAAQKKLRDAIEAGCPTCPLTAAESAYRRVVKWEHGGQAALDYKDKARPLWNGRIVFLPERIEQVARGKPAVWFVDSMSDLFHADVPTETIEQVFAAMRDRPDSIFQVLTKRPIRMRDFCRLYYPAPLPNVWLGTSVENQETADSRLSHLRITPAAVRWVSAEPLLDDINDGGRCLGCGQQADFGGRCNCPNAGRLHQWVVGFESGPNKRRGPIDAAR